MTREFFGVLPDGTEAHLYTIRGGNLTATVSDYGAHLVSLFVPDRNGNMADVVLGFDDANGYRTGNGGFLGAIVGRNANRIQNSSFMMDDMKIRLIPNENENNLHSGPDFFYQRMWELVRCGDDFITLRLVSPQGDQGFPGRAIIDVTYSLKSKGELHIQYKAISNRDTVMNLTNHSYFNLAGHDKTDKAMAQQLILPARFFCPDDVDNIPTGELRSVGGSPMDFRAPKTFARDIEAAYEPLHFQGGYDHNFEVFCNPCAILIDPESGREMAVHTDCPGIQLYTGNFLNETGKGGIRYGFRTGVALETQFFPDAVHHPEWKQPFLKQDEVYSSTTVYQFSW